MAAVFNAVPYSSFVKLKISSSDELPGNLRQMVDGIWRIIGGGWLDEVCMYDNLSSGFLNGRCAIDEVECGVKKIYYL